MTETERIAAARERNRHLVERNAALRALRKAQAALQWASGGCTWEGWRKVGKPALDQIDRTLALFAEADPPRAPSVAG